MRRIVFSTDSFSRGGKERQMVVLASYLLQNNYELFFFAKRADEGNNYLTEYKIDEKLISTYKGYRDYQRKLNNLKPEIIVSWDITSSFYNLLLYRNQRVSFINGSIRHGLRRLKVSHLVRSIIIWLSPFVMANSEAGLKVNNLKPGKRRFVLYNGIETNFLNNLTKMEIENLRKKLIPGYLENPGFVYISVANLVPYKDYFTVLKVLAQLKEKFLFYYLILGDGPMRRKIEKTINDFGLEKEVLLIGKTENVKDYLFAGDIMIHSSRGEGISNAVLEGMYAGLPVIATNVGGIPETVFPGSSMLFPFKDYGALYQCLLKSKELKTSFNPESDEYHDHLKKFSVDTMVNKFEEIIEKVMEGKVK